MLKCSIEYAGDKYDYSYEQLYTGIVDMSCTVFVKRINQI